MSCRDKIKQRCGSNIYAPCVKYELEVPEFSPLFEEGCLTIEETTNDLYEHVGQIKEEIDLSDLGTKCLTYVQEEGKTYVKNVLLMHEEKICELQERIVTLETTAICDMSITECGIDLSGITDICSNPITTLGELLAYLVTQTNP